MPIAKAIMPGDRFGRWTVLEKTEKRIFPSESWVLYQECRCDCGTVQFVTRHTLFNGESTSCGCSQLEIMRITPGERFGRWVALEETDIHIIASSGKKVYRTKCRCNCGTMKFIANSRLRTGQALSCGCLKIEASIRIHTQHGHSSRYGHASGGKTTRVYRIWGAMIRRCTKPQTSSYKNYGARGITVCERWLKFENFLEDMGQPPEGTSIDRLNNDGNYCAENCEWKTRKQQAINRRTTIFLTFNGERLSLVEWAQRLGVKRTMLLERYNQGWTPAQIIMTPRYGKRKT